MDNRWGGGGAVTLSTMARMGLLVRDALVEAGQVHESDMVLVWVWVVRLVGVSWRGGRPDVSRASVGCVGEAVGIEKN